MVKDTGRRSNPLRMRAKAGQAAMLWTNGKMQIKNLLRGRAPTHLFLPLMYFFPFRDYLSLQPRGAVWWVCDSGQVSRILLTGLNRGPKPSQSEPSMSFCWNNQERGNITKARAP